MKLGKLNVELVSHEIMGEVFRIKAKNPKESYHFKVEAEQLVLYVSKSTALLLSDYIDNTLNDETKWEK